MFASPQVTKRLLSAEDNDADGGECSLENVPSENPCIFLACLEGLKAMGVDVRRAKPFADDGEKEPPQGSFGRPLAELCQEGVDTACGRVPRLLHRLVTLLEAESTLKTEFIFRVSGALTRINNSKAVVDKEELSHMPPHDLAGLLKMFLREMPQGLLNPAYSTYVAIPRLEESQQARALQLACGLLPKENRDSLKYLMTFMAHVTSFSAHNKMDAHNLALLLAPNILYHASKTAKLDDARMAQEKCATDVVKLLIHRPDIIGALPLDVLQAAQAMDPEDARKRYTEHTCPRKRRSSIQKMLRMVGDAGSSVRNAFSGRLLSHAPPISAAATAALADLPKPTSPLASTPIAATRNVARTASSAAKIKSPSVMVAAAATAVPPPSSSTVSTTATTATTATTTTTTTNTTNSTTSTTSSTSSTTATSHTSFPSSLSSSSSLPALALPTFSAPPTAAAPALVSIVTKTPAKAAAPPPAAPSALKRKSTTDMTPSKRTPSLPSQHRAARAAAQAVHDPRRGRENAPPAAVPTIKEAIEKEAFDCSTESPSKRFRAAAAMATKKEPEQTDSEGPAGGTRSHRRSVQASSDASPAVRRMSLDTSGEADVFMAMDGRDAAMFGFATTPTVAKRPSKTTEQFLRHPSGSTPHLVRHSPLSMKTARSPREAPVTSDSCWV